MGLLLGKSFNRNYNLRIPILNGFYNIGIFYNSKSTFLLFSIDSDFSLSKEMKHNTKIAMFKNIESSLFCSTFLDLHNYKNNTLDITNQFKNIKGEYSNDIVFILNENITLSKTIFQESIFYDQLLIYGFTLASNQTEFAFILAERQNINTKLKKKTVRTSGIQIATTPTLELIDDYYKESISSKKIYDNLPNIEDKTIRLV